VPDPAIFAGHLCRSAPINPARSMPPRTRRTVRRADLVARASQLLIAARRQLVARDVGSRRMED